MTPEQTAMYAQITEAFMPTSVTFVGTPEGTVSQVFVPASHGDPLGVGIAKLNRKDKPDTKIGGLYSLARAFKDLGHQIENIAEAEDQKRYGKKA